MPGYISKRLQIGVVANPPSGMVKLVPLASGLGTVTVIRNGTVDRGGSVGGWQASERVLREDADWWKSIPKGTVSIPCLLDVDAIPDARTIEKRLRALYDMGQPDGQDDPTAIHLYGDVPMCHPPTWVWKLDDIQLGDDLFLEDQPTVLRRQELTLSLSTYSVTRGVTKVTVKRTRDKHDRRRRRTISARKGDTLRAIAVRQLGSSGAYAQIREWNKKLRHTDPDAPLRAGTKIVLH